MCMVASASKEGDQERRRTSSRDVVHSSSRRRCAAERRLLASLDELWLPHEQSRCFVQVSERQARGAADCSNAGPCRALAFVVVGVDESLIQRVMIVESPESVPAVLQSFLSELILSGLQVRDGCEMSRIFGMMRCC